MKKIFAFALVFCFSVSAFAQTPFDCSSDFFQVFGEDGSSLSYDLETNSSVIAPDSYGDRLNAMGYRVADNFAYGIDSQTRNLVRIGADGNGVDVGPVAGLPNIVGYFSGDFADDGLLYVLSNSDASPNTLYGINVDTLTVENVIVSPGLRYTTIDFAFNVVDRRFYAVPSDNVNNQFPLNFLIAIDINTAEVEIIGPTGVVGGYASMFSDGNGNIYGHERASGIFYRFNTETGLASSVGNNQIIADVTGGVDGFYCVANSGPSAVFVPTLSECGMIAMVALLGLVGFIAVRKRVSNV